MIVKVLCYEDWEIQERVLGFVNKTMDELYPARKEWLEENDWALDVKDIHTVDWSAGKQHIVVWEGNIGWVWVIHEDKDGCLELIVDTVTTREFDGVCKCQEHLERLNNNEIS